MASAFQANAFQATAFQATLSGPALALLVEARSGVASPRLSLPVEAGGAFLGVPVEALAGVALPRLSAPVETTGIVPSLAMPVEARGWARSPARGLPVEAAGLTQWQFPLTFTVLEQFVAAFPVQFRVLPDPIAGRVFPVTFDVLEVLDPLWVSFRVVPQTVVDLFNAQGTGGAVGVPADVQLPTGRVDKTP